MNKCEEKAEVPNASSLPVLNSKISCSSGTQAPELEMRVGEQSEAPWAKEKWSATSNLPHPWNTQTVGPGGTPEGMERAGAALTGPLPIIYQWLERSQLTASCQMWCQSTGQVGMRIPGRSGLSVWPWSQGRSWRRSSQVAHTGQAGIRPSQRGPVYTRQVLLDHPDLLWQSNPLVAGGNVVVVLSLDFRKAFDTISAEFFWTNWLLLARVGYSAGWKTGWVVGNGVISSWGWSPGVCSGASHLSMISEGVEGTPVRWRWLQGGWECSEDRKALQRGLVKGLRHESHRGALGV